MMENKRKSTNFSQKDKTLTLLNCLTNEPSKCTVKRGNTSSFPNIGK